MAALTGRIPADERTAWSVYDFTAGSKCVSINEGRKGGNYPYTFIGIIQKDRRASHYGNWKRDRSNVIREVSNIVYTFMSKRYNLVA